MQNIEAEAIRTAHERTDLALENRHLLGAVQAVDFELQVVRVVHRDAVPRVAQRGAVRGH